MNDVKHLKVKNPATLEQWLAGGGFITALAFTLLVLPMLLPFARLS